MQPKAKVRPVYFQGQDLNLKVTFTYPLAPMEAGVYKEERHLKH